MKNDGKIQIGFIGILFIILVVLAILGKSSFWHVVLFPIYAILGFFGLIGGIVIGCLLIIGILWCICWVLDRKR